MAKNMQPVLKRARTLGIEPGFVGIYKKSKRKPKQNRRKPSNYALQLTEKQKVRFVYGIQEKQLRRTFARAEKKSGNVGENLLTLLEKGFRPECDITVGNMSGGNGKVRVNRNIACTPGEVESFKKLDGMEIKLFSQTVPSEVSSPFMPQLESALKQVQ